MRSEFCGCECSSHAAAGCTQNRPFLGCCKHSLHAVFHSSAPVDLLRASISSEIFPSIAPHARYNHLYKFRFLFGSSEASSFFDQDHLSFNQGADGDLSLDSRRYNSFITYEIDDSTVLAYSITFFLDIHDNSDPRGYAEEKSWVFQQPLKLAKSLCLHRCKIWWMIPKLLRQVERDVPPETYFLLGQLENDGKDYILLFPVADTVFGFSLEGYHDQLQINGHAIHSNLALSDAYESAVIVSTGKNVFEVIRRTLDIAKTHIRSLNGNFAEAQHQSRHSPSFFPRGSGPAFVDRLGNHFIHVNKYIYFIIYLGWCTWDAFYTHVNAKKILESLEHFNSRDIRPGYLILDDGWQKTSLDSMPNSQQWNGMLTSFGTKDTFFDGAEVKSLKELVAAVKSDHAIDSFLVWHALTGYWRGVHISEDSEDGVISGAEMKQFGPELAFPRLSQAEYRGSHEVRGLYDRTSQIISGVGLVSPLFIEKFFAAYHASLAEMGVDGVKCDVQSMLPSLVSSCLKGGINLASFYHLALQKSVGNSFSRRGKEGGPTFPLIHCMAHSQGTLLSIAAMYPDLQDDASTHLLRPLVRGSDDFWPRIPAAQGPHIFVNTLNSMLMSEIGLHDWDMFASNIGPSSEMHAASRAISGGPVYTSDAPSSQKDEIYHKLAFPDGSIPRCIRNARPVARMLFEDPQRVAGTPLLIQSANADGFVIGVFNVAGAIMENDLDCFRALPASEMTWPEGFELPHTDSTLPVWEQPELLPALGVKSLVSLDDVEEFIGAERIDVVAFKHSDHSVVTIFNLIGPIASSEASVAVHVPYVFGFDIVTFAKIHHLSPVPSMLSPWVAAIGAVDLYNPGGAVLCFQSDTVANSDDVAELLFSFDLLGSGRYLFVSNALLEIVSSASLDNAGNNIEDTTKRTEREVALVKNEEILLYHTIVTITASLKNLPGVQRTRLGMRSLQVMASN